mgnify:CR=1 FL=1
MSENKSKTLSFRVAPSYYESLKRTAEALGMSQSEVLAESLDEYLERRIDAGVTAYLDRCAPYIGEGHSPDALKARLDTVLEGVTMQGLRTWSDRDLVPEEVFKQFVELKLKPTAKAKREKVAAKA